MKRKIIIFLAFVTACILVLSMLYFSSPTMANNNNNPKNLSKEVELHWILKNENFVRTSNFVSKDDECIIKEKINKPNLHEINFNLTWIDDKTTFNGAAGLDSLTMDVTNPDGKSVAKTAKSSKNSKNGVINIEFSVNKNAPKSKIFEIEESEKNFKIDIDDFNNYKWTDKEFIIKISVEIGEIRLLKRLAEKGNPFTLTISYSYFYPSIYGENRTYEQSFIEGSMKESSYIPPYLCPYCKPYYESINDYPTHHLPWCPYADNENDFENDYDIVDRDDDFFDDYEDDNSNESKVNDSEKSIIPPFFNFINKYIKFFIKTFFFVEVLTWLVLFLSFISPIF
jgi:hypothetical protein